MTDDTDRASQIEIQKAAFKEAVREWLEEKFALLGKWSLGVMMAGALAALFYFWLNTTGWHQTGGTH